MSVIIGVDAGGTATTARVWRDGAIIGTACGGAGAVRPTRAVAAATRIADTVRSALTEPRLLRGDVLVVGAAGVGRETEREELRAALRTHDLAGRLLVTTDVELAMAAAFGAGPGLLLVAGTGSIALHREASGAVRRAGGHGWQMGDEGSGYWIGRQALQALSRAHDTRGPATTLGERFGPTLRLASHDELVRWSVAAAPSEVASLAALVQDAAAAGDAVASQIVDDAARELLALITTLGGAEAPVEVALVGGLLRGGQPLRDRLVALLEADPRLTVRAGDLDPVTGALVLAESDHT
ncbi:MAG TPA: BadF/BadG/BcrA/BcrD ATPase family protein [Gemmatimonadales bacterium]|nr:BadF/BadG/BcrA/BcrD ATPase family protein [Gemmatimonadales bacterium]